MPGSDTEFDTIDAALPYVRELRSKLVDAERLRDQGVAAIMSQSWRDEMSPDPAGGFVGRYWDAFDDPTTTVLLRRVKHLSFSIGLIRGDSRWPNIPDWNDIRISPLDRLATRVEGGARSGDVSLYTQRSDVDLVSPARIMFASGYLRARLDELHGGGGSELPVSLLRCYYVVLREFYTIQATTGSIGSVRAGGRSQISSSFAGSEAVRAIVHMARGAARTASFLRRLASAARYVELVDSLEDAAAEYSVGDLLAPEWVAVERRRLRASVDAILDGSEGRVLVDFKPLLSSLTDAPGSLASFIDAASTSALDFMRRTSANLLAVVDEAKRLNGMEQKRTHALAAELDAARDGSHQVPPEFDQWSSSVLSQSAHEYVTGRLRGFAMRVQLALKSGAESELAPNQLELVAAALDSAASGISDLLSPVRSRMQADLLGALFSIRATGSASGMADLAFSAACLGSITDRWDQPALREAVGVLSTALDDEGRVPQGDPFLVIGDRGGALYPANAQVLRAILYVCGSVPGVIDTEVCERVIRYFDDTKMRVPLDPELAESLEGAPTVGVAWSQFPGRPGLKASPWMTAVATLCLHRLCVTIRRKLNEMVGQFLKLESVDDLDRSSIPIDELMCSDIGLASALESRPMITETLEGVRKHLSARSADRRAHSLIFYGPPGTGKTTLVRSLAASARCSLVTVTPSDLLIRGGELVQAQALAVMEILASLSRTVILFDEFDPVIYSRGVGARQPSTVFSFLTSSMLPHLSDLYSSARENGSAYVLATNYVEDLDEAAIRGGRFDEKILVLPPDAPSRVCRLVRVLREYGAFDLAWRAHLNTKRKRADVLARLLDVAAWSDGIAVEALVGKMTFRRFWTHCGPDHIEWPVKLPSIWAYILEGEGAGRIASSFPMPVDVRAARSPNDRPSRPENELSVEQAVSATLVAAWDKALRRWVAGSAGSRRRAKVERYVQAEWDSSGDGRVKLSHVAREDRRKRLEQLAEDLRR